ncbi:MAG: DUF4405 domain-containing protein [Candidatus Woesearchaeota archaeon]
MNKATLNYIIDACLGSSFLAVFFTGLLKLPVLISALGMHKRTSLYAGLTAVHDISGIVMGLFALAHIALHWKFIALKTKNVFKKKA